MCLNEAYSKFRVREFCLINFLLNFALKFAVRKVQANQISLELNGTHKILFYADDINLFCDCISTIKENKGILLKGRKYIAPEISPQYTKHMIMFRHLNTGQKHIIRIDNESFKNKAEFKYWGRQ
jgi:hypothetical protein